MRNRGVGGWRTVSSWLTSVRIAGETDVERSSERNRRAITSSVAGLALRGSSFVVVLISVPLTLKLLGPIRFGMWMTIASVIALLSATDLGIGNGVLNNIARAYGQGDTAAARRYFGSGLVALSGIALALGIAFLIAYPLIPWSAIYNVGNDPQAAAEAGPASAVFVATFLVGLPLSLVGQVRAAYQEGFVQSAFAGFGNLMTIVLLLIAVATRASLPVLVLAMASGTIVAALINLVVLLRIQRPLLAPHRPDVTKEALRSVVGVGLAFLVLQIAYTIAFSTDRIVVAHVAGPAAVADYAVVYRLFSIPSGLATIALLPLWAAYREAITRQDIAWARQTLTRSIKVTLLATIPLVVILAIVGPQVVISWTNEGVAPTYGLYLALGAFTIVFALANAFAMLLNGAQMMRFQIATMSLMAALGPVAGVYLASRVGVAGVALGSAIAVVAALLIPAMFYVPRLFRRLEHQDERLVAVAAPYGTTDVRQ